jgi:hypothetical protein
MKIPRLALFVCLVGMMLTSSCRTGNGGPNPTIEITFPEEGSLQRDERIRVTGTAENVDQLEVDGNVAEVVGDEWEVLVPVGQGEVTVTATGDGATDSVTFTVDSRPPALEVTTPERALYMTTGDGESVRVAGTVSDDGTGLEIIKVGEQIIHPDDAGNWEWTMPLEPGLNVIETTARDIAGNETEDIRGVMYGEYVAAEETIDPAFNIVVDESSIPAVEAVVEGFVTSDNLMAMVGQFENEYVEISSIELDPVDFNATLARGAIQMEFVATNVAIEGTFELSDGDPLPLTVEVTQLRMTVEATPIVTEDGLLDVEFTDPVLELSPDDLSYDVADLSDEDNQFLEETVINIAQSGFGYVLSEGLFTSLYDPDILKRKIVAFGRELVFDVRFKNIDVFPDAIVLTTTVQMPAEKPDDVRDVPGALNRTSGPGDGTESSRNMRFTLTENAVDRIMHGVWHSGMLHLQLAGDDFSGVELPFELTSGSLATLVDSKISSVAGPDVPAGLRLRPQFPPISEFDAESSRLVIQAGEFAIDLLLFPPGEDPIVLATVSAFLELGVKVNIDGVVVNLGFDTELKADVSAEPEVDLADEEIEGLLEELIALVPVLFADGLNLAGEADITWVKLTNPEIVVHGANDDYSTVGLDLEPNPMGIPTPD